MSRLNLAVYVVCALCYAAVCAAAQQYPSVRAMRRTFDVPDVSKANVSLIIRSRRGSPLYHLQCHSADYTGDPNFNYSGDFECRLSPIPENYAYSTLFTEDINQSKDWESRARFFSADLRGVCARIPDFGAVRSFKLRHMRLTLRIMDPVFGRSGKLLSLRLRVVVEQDASADRNIAAIVPLPRNAPAQCKIDRYFPTPEESWTTRGRQSH